MLVSAWEWGVIMVPWVTYWESDSNEIGFQTRGFVVDEAIIRIVYSLGEDLAWIRIKV